MVLHNTALKQHELISLSLSKQQVFSPRMHAGIDKGKRTTTLPGCYYLQLRMRETVISLADGRILGVRFSELSMDMIKLT